MTFLNTKQYQTTNADYQIRINIIIICHLLVRFRRDLIKDLDNILNDVSCKLMM